ncbi:hypothetical protein CLW00_11036 [Mongoliibacter ruber]|uniref:Uncharacterized protein n=1 Tax=Mongoliibacter ruber TaxID=1750599 RepID=A0A2T0WGW7_9BACT|nr:hypothetical protein CLW00_11036 [Mongoliibacter ruber]
MVQWLKVNLLKVKSWAYPELGCYRARRIDEMRNCVTDEMKN